MSVGPLANVLASAAGAPLAQTKGSDLDRSAQEVQSQQRIVHSQQKAEAASGIGETNGEDHEPAERDADGRRPWEAPPRPKDAETTAAETNRSKLAKDPSGQSGTLLDLSG
jgi:hypothetical protein